MLLYLIHILFIIPSVSATDPLDMFCSDEFTNYTLNSPFKTNLKILLDSLPSNTSLTGFYNTSIGEGTNKVYGQALCRGDVTEASVCEKCVKEASQEILSQCKSEDAIIWYELCQVRYSFQMFFSIMVYTGKYPPVNNEEKNVASDDQVGFNKSMLYLMGRLGHEAAYNPASQMFATGEINFHGEDKNIIYGLVQCTRDMSNDSCSDCLDKALVELEICCSSLEGGSVLSRNCNVRFGLSKFFNTSDHVFTYPSSGVTRKRWMIALSTCVSISIVAALFVCCAVNFNKKRGRGKGEDEEGSEAMILQQFASPKGVAMTEEGELVSSEESLVVNLTTIRAATGDFSDENKLGEGGFGAVYKGVLDDGKEVAVKRLSRKSWQGLEELKNEVILIARLQHRNLVRLLGCVIERDEMLLMYEYMPNKSLDTFIFDSERRSELDWKTCFGIIVGIARGLLYLHQGSRLKIIHRDLKPSNVLLDDEMVAKISDFGMARIFGENKKTAKTKRVVGTFGYMSPEYAMEGLFSVKSDVFSFGVILLEIISGNRNSGFYLTHKAPTLLVHAWRLWNEGKELDLVDPFLMESAGLNSEIVRCIRIGLLCVQEDPADRLTMSDVEVLLGSESNMDLPQPKRPPYSVGRAVPIQMDLSLLIEPTANELTLSTLSPI